MNDHRRENRLIHETSPYLLQHAHNPVDWFPWSEEAISEARKQDKPIFLSIGYSACHWCHVMEKESFENSATAAVMNERFINIKVDREERPDLDQIYMAATQLITQHGGWPMSVWLTPDLKPFYAGTYFPPEPRHGLPSFVKLCEHLADAWSNRRQEVLDSSEEVTRRVQQLQTVTPGAEVPDTKVMAEGGRALEQYIDGRFGGLGTAPKFPHSTEMRLLLRSAAMRNSSDARKLVELTFDHMVRGGICDQIGGGFHRYSTDQYWLVPHFEKMLYDNALIPLALREAAQATSDPVLAASYRQSARECLDFVLREMTSPEGAFYSTLDADSEGVEGKFFVWSLAEVQEVLGGELAEVAAYAYDVSETGNWEHANILHLPKPLDQTAKLLGMETDVLHEKLQTVKCKLFARRETRIRPGRDEKVLTAWNGMMIETLAEWDGGARTQYADAARRAAEFILTHLRDQDGKLHRTYKDGRARLNGYLEDYAYLANGLVSLYEATFDVRWIREALSLVETMIEQFWDDADGGFFFTGKDHEELIARGKDPHDGAMPSGNAMAATAMARLAKLTGLDDLRQKTDRLLSVFGPLMTSSPMAAAQMLIALGIHRGPTLEIALVGEPDDPETQRALAAIHDRFLPNRVIALRRPDQTDDDIAPVALLAGKSPAGAGVTIYLCENFTCREPIQGADDLAQVLANR